MFRPNNNSDTDDCTRRHAWSRSSSRRRPEASASSRRRSRGTSSDAGNPSPSYREPPPPRRSEYPPTPPPVSYPQSQARERSRGDRDYQTNVIEVVLDEPDNDDHQYRRHLRGHHRSRDRDREQSVHVDPPQHEYMNTSFRARAAPSTAERPRSDLEPPTPTQVPHRPASRLVAAAFQHTAGYQSYADMITGPYARSAQTSYPATPTARYTGTGDTHATPTYQHPHPTLAATNQSHLRPDTSADTRPRPPTVIVTPAAPVEEPSTHYAARTTRTSTGEARYGRELVKFERDMGIASKSRYDISVYSRKVIAYPSVDALMFTSPVHFPMMSDDGKLEWYKVCEHVTSGGSPSSCKAFHTPIHPSSISLSEIPFYDTGIYSAAIIPSDHSIFTHPSDVSVKMDNTSTYEEIQDRYRPQQTLHTERYKEWMSTDAGKLRRSQEQYIINVNSNIRERNAILSKRREEIEGSSNLDDALRSIQESVNELNRVDTSGHGSGPTSREWDESGSIIRGLNRVEQLRERLSALRLAVDMTPASFEVRTPLIESIRDLQRDVQQNIQSLRQSILNQSERTHSRSYPSDHPYMMALRRLNEASERVSQVHSNTPDPLTWLEEDEARLRAAKENLRKYYRSLDWMN
ncbi:hypothetical protein I302_103861 [Kwoniella bestiolae CBS 10118]|uniref:Uncharacterized protein n=1 Tax=Kwoniella bestiolae CBS 10118 TaxID=1296100 RepID=A0A1B9G9P4_9TREE|nr:hypothetical protein I302_02566 [Kwoniella bestiolae CBS 10118]OCF27721.1 hypothetical protein I302_02566 [Kwoniella bestiolae CBS 10118]